MRPFATAAVLAAGVLGLRTLASELPLTFSGIGSAAAPAQSRLHPFQNIMVSVQ